MSSLTTTWVDAVKEVGCSSTIGQILNPKKKQKQLEPSVFGESSVEEHDDKAGINQMLQREVTQERNTKQTQQKKTVNPTVC